MAQGARAAGKGEESDSFEARMERLERLLQELEGGQLSLEDGVARYQEGVRLLRDLNETLGGAERRVEELTATLRRELEELERTRDPGADA